MNVHISGVYIENGYEEADVDCYNSDDVVISFGNFVGQNL